MAAWTSRRRCWQGLTRSSALLALAIFAQGCSPKGQQPRGAFADLDALVRMHPANPALQELERQVGSAVPSAAAREPADLAPPSVPPIAEPSKLPKPTAEQTGLERLRQELSQDVARRISLKKKEVERTSRAAIQQEEARLASERLAARAQIAEKRGPRISRLESSIALLRQRLQSRSLALGERTQVESHIAQLQKELDGLQADEEKELGAVDARYRRELDEFRKQRARQDETELANTRAALEQDLERAVEQYQARVTRAFAPPEMPAPRLGRPQAPEAPHRARRVAPPVPEPSARDGGAVAAQQQRLRESIRRETAETAKALAARHNVRLSFDAKSKQSLPDITDRVAAWLKRYWSAHPPEKEATQR